MKRALSILSLLCCTSLCGASFDQPLKDKMFNDLEILRSSFEVKYAPAAWKQEQFKWSLDEETKKAKGKIQAKTPCTLKDFHQILRDFFNSANDYHARVRFHSTEAAFLPFHVQEVDGKYYVTWVSSKLKRTDSKKISQDDANMFSGVRLKVGDQISEFNGKPIADVVNSLKKKGTGRIQSETNQRLAEIALTSRFGSHGDAVPEGYTTITLSRNAEDKFLVKWFYLPEEITSNYKIEPFVDFTLSRHPLLHKKRYISFYDDAQDSIFHEKDNGKLLGGLKSFLPPLGKITWASPSTSFDAYIYESPGRNLIGFVRIADYMGDDFDSTEFEKIISMFKKNVDAVVIDQMNNPGGSLFYLYGLVSMLSDKPLKSLKESSVITQEEVAQALDLKASLDQFKTEAELIEGFGETVDGYTVNMDLAKSVKEYCKFVISQWDEGKTLTSPNFLYGIKELTPNPRVRFKGPILVLVNSLDFSCADLFPALLQDNHRAKIMGTTTAGAGGYVTTYSYPNRFGIAEYSLTGSLTQRADKTYLENNGVTPDVIYNLTVNDIKDGYKDFARAINSEIDKMVK
jgi:C-terminal processing protease CtpA/Prc